MNLYIRAFVNSLSTAIILITLGFIIYYFPLMSVVALIFMFIFIFWINELEEKEKDE